MKMFNIADNFTGKRGFSAFNKINRAKDDIFNIIIILPIFTSPLPVSNKIDIL